MKKSVFFLMSILILMVLFQFTSCNILTETEQTQPESSNEKSIDQVANNFFNDNPDLKNQSGLIIENTKSFFDLNAGTPEFDGKSPLSIQAIYAHGIEGPAYYELWLTENGTDPKGWILMSATNKDFPIAAFSHNGIPYSKSLIDNSSNKSLGDNKIYRFGVSYYAMENETGQKVAEFGDMPTRISTGTQISNSGQGDSAKGINSSQFAEEAVEPVEGIDYKSIEDYESLKQYYTEYYYTASRANTAEKLNSVMKNIGNNAVARDQYIYRWVSGPQCLYTQIPANTSANWTSCWSGCNNNAWTSLYGWWDKNMGKSRLIPTTTTGETCPTYRNTTARRNVVDPVQMYFRSVCSTYCSGGGGWTYWSNAWKGYQYTTAKSYGYSYSYQWCNSAGDKVNLANVLTDCIANNYRPAHVGANSHFYVAYGWAQWDTNTKWTWVYCYPGWSENHNDDVWISWYDINSSTRVFVY